MTRSTIDELLARSREGMRRLTPAESWAAMARGSRLVDIRSDEQVRLGGTIEGALRVERNVLEWRMDPDCGWAHPDAPGIGDHVILLCRQGYQSSLAARTLRDMGFARATDVIGGFEAWRAAGIPTRRRAGGEPSA